MIQLKSQRNPYVIGRPINEPKTFFGRQKQIAFIEENLRQGEKVILLHGQRRIGKSSLLQNIPQLVKVDNFAFVSFDLEYHSQDKLENLLENLAETIVEQLEIPPDKVAIPKAQQIEEEKDIFCAKFLPKIYEHLKDQNLVLLLDEFDALNNKHIGVELESLFKQLKNIAHKNSKLFVIIFAGRKPADISNLLKIFPKVPVARVGLLDNESIKQLIIEPVGGSLSYEPTAIQAITDLSAGHPYFIQILCFAVFSRARELQKWEVAQEDVENIIDKAVELAEAGFAWYWEALSVTEKVVFSAVAEAQKITLEKNDQELEKDPLMLLKSHQDVLSRDLLEKLTEELTLKGFLNEQGNKVKIELVQRWLIQRHPLWHEIRELEKLDKQEVKDTYETLNQTPQISNNQKQSPIIQSRALSQQPKSLEPNIPSVKPDKNKVHRNRGEIWLLPGMIFLGAAAIASFIIIFYDHNRSDQNKNQNSVPNATSPSQ
ncbi:AAA family ATPase [Desmonostoc muscorum LEGE 12446]|uniref:ATP-binding protein n=1 Tax=Desmonostoc muscorum LEGE 12446 TaxID=1828758 RepID=A0A8J7DHT5_DESMC|nr:AAA family ATPase [Desmonostoc muscorum]MCF2150121.1 AAA family ATPase [Desmonostoc muscorum LEGE 12446]